MSEARQSNIELLRIIAMMFIIAHHFLVHGMQLWEYANLNDFAILSLDSAFFLGVNVFVLISGYCGIKLKVRKLFRIWLLCGVVGAIGYFCHLFLDHASIGRSIIYNTVFSISHTPGTWYIKEYFFLMLISPLLNNGLEVLTQKQFASILLILSIINVYFGWFWQDEINNDGYNLHNFIWIYSIGYYIKNYGLFRVNPYYYLLSCFGVAIINTLLFFFFPSCATFTYNNPFLVIGSIALFMFFLSISFNSNIINSLAKQCLSVYLIHENCYISRMLYGDCCSDYYSRNVFSFMVSVVGVYVLCILIDYIIQRGIISPILILFDRLFNKLPASILQWKL